MKIFISTSKSEASKQAAKLGLHHDSFGRYANKEGVITHKSVGGKLVPVKKGSSDTSKKSVDISKHKQKIIDDVASGGHADWQKDYRKGNPGTKTRIKKTKDADWIKKNGKEEVDILNTDYKDLPEDWKAENKKNAEAVVAGIEKALKNGKLTKGYVDIAADHVHEEWLKRNGEWADPKQKLPFAKLSKEEKDKDRLFVVKALKSYTRHSK